MSKQKIYNKLVRNKIPDIIHTDGRTCLCETLTQEKYLQCLDKN